ncbi:N/A [soil metagenome]
MKSAPRTVLISAAVLATGVAGAAFLLSTAPKTAPEERERAARIVQTLALSPRDEDVVVTGFGSVIPSQSVTIQPEVTGRVTDHHEALTPGGIVSAGEELVVIERADYALAVAEKRAAREEALFEVAVEEGRQTIAAREWEELKDDLPSGQSNEALVLREPHLRRTRAMLEMADNAVARAELDLARTSIPAPFNAVVLDEAVEVGQRVETGGTIASLAGTDTFWIRVTLPLADVRRIQLPTADRLGASARVLLTAGDGDEAAWDGQVARLLGDLETTGRMARLLVTVTDPLRLTSREDGLPLLLGSYVRVEIDAGRLDDVLEIPRAALRSGDRIWLVGPDNTLQIRDADILWRRDDSVLIANLLQDGERLVVSDLKSALPGMELAPQPLQDESKGGEVANVETHPQP